MNIIYNILYNNNNNNNNIYFIYFHFKFLRRNIKLTWFFFFGILFHLNFKFRNKYTTKGFLKILSIDFELYNLINSTNSNLIQPT